MSSSHSIFEDIKNLLQRDYRGVNIAVYAVATTGLAYSIHRIRPVSKFSKASKIPSHFIKNHEPLKGVYEGVQHSPVRILVNHQAPIYLPLWHSSKPPLPVKLWGVDIVSGNAVNWLECVAKGQKVTLKPIAREKDDLVSEVILHLPVHQKKSMETVDVGQKLVELGFAKASVPPKLQKKTLESQLAPGLLLAEARAKSNRNGIWSDQLPPIPAYVVFWRKGTQLTMDLFMHSIRKLLHLTGFAAISALRGVKVLASKPFTKSAQGQSPKVQTA